MSAVRLIVVALALAAPSAAQAQAALRIWQVFAGTAAEPNAQFVEVRAYSAGQTELDEVKLTIWDASDQLLGHYYTGSMDNGALGASVLFATQEAEALFSLSADVSISAELVARGGKVCIGTDPSFGSTGTGSGANCAAWGNFAFTTSVGAKFQPATGLLPGSAMTRGDLQVNRGDSALDFLLSPPSPRNNAGQTGTVVPTVCGDRVVAGLEACDDGNRVDTDECRNDCRAPTCGDALVSVGEQCEPPGVGQCDSDCQFLPAEVECGDGTRAGDEECDDGNNDDDDGCNAVCVRERCGDGVEQSNEQCDDRNASGGDGCSSACRLERCGDRQLDAGEECDDGNTTTGDGCSESCELESVGCGNGTKSGTEECDDGDRVNDDGCSSTCRIERCGDRAVQPARGEECDDGNTNDTDDCQACLARVCGNARVETGEECDDGNQGSDDGCTAGCRRERCGDGTLQASLGEECDDRNQIDEDGCSLTCKLEGCGDGVRQTGERCDDGNGEDGDGCSASCAVEKCGDKEVQAGLGEECDDGNTRDRDGCSAECRTETNPPAPSGCGCAGGGADVVAASTLLALLARRRRRGGR
jgi:cysteine-rich repeat protein